MLLPLSTCANWESLNLESDSQVTADRPKGRRLGLTVLALLLYAVLLCVFLFYEVLVEVFASD